MIQSTTYWSKKVASNSLVTSLASTMFKVMMQFGILEKVCSSKIPHQSTITKRLQSKIYQEPMLRAPTKHQQGFLCAFMDVATLQPTRLNLGEGQQYAITMPLPIDNVLGCFVLELSYRALSMRLSIYNLSRLPCPNDRGVYRSFLFMLI